MARDIDDREGGSPSPAEPRLGRLFRSSATGRRRVQTLPEAPGLRQAPAGPGPERAFAAHPAAYVRCDPHNPVGTVHSPAELEALVRLARIYRVVLVSDEIHAPLVLPGAVFTPLLTVPGGPGWRSA